MENPDPEHRALDGLANIKRELAAKGYGRRFVMEPLDAHHDNRYSSGALPL